MIERLNKELRAIVTSDEFKKRIIADGGGPAPSTPEEHAANIVREEGKWSALIRSSASSWSEARSVGNQMELSGLSRARACAP